MIDTLDSFTVHLFYKKTSTVIFIKRGKAIPRRKIMQPIQLYHLCLLTEHSRSHSLNVIC